MACAAHVALIASCAACPISSTKPTPYWLKFRFDEPPDGTGLEGVCGRGDSGGPALIQRDSQLLLAGVSSWQHQGGNQLGLYGCIEHYARVSCYLDWIREMCSI